MKVLIQFLLASLLLIIGQKQAYAWMTCMPFCASCSASTISGMSGSQVASYGQIATNYTTSNMLLETAKQGMDALSKAYTTSIDAQTLSQKVSNLRQSMAIVDAFKMLGESGKTEYTVLQKQCSSSLASIANSLGTSLQNQFTQLSKQKIELEFNINDRFAFNDIHALRGRQLSHVKAYQTTMNLMAFKELKDQFQNNKFANSGVIGPRLAYLRSKGQEAFDISRGLNTNLAEEQYGNLIASIHNHSNLLGKETPNNVGSLVAQARDLMAQLAWIRSSEDKVAIVELEEVTEKQSVHSLTENFVNNRIASPDWYRQIQKSRVSSLKYYEVMAQAQEMKLLYQILKAKRLANLVKLQKQLRAI